MTIFKSGFIALAMMGAVAVPAFAADADPAPSYEDMGFYLRGDIGWSFLEWGGGSDDNSLLAGAGAGYQFNDYLRGDVRYDYSFDYDVAPGSDMSVQTLMGNAYLDVPTDSMFTPYVGVGAGYGWADVSNGKDRDGFAYSLMAGSSIGLTDNMDVDVGYRFRQILNDGADVTEHQVMTGLRVKF